jgi:hypothetical protein
MEMLYPYQQPALGPDTLGLAISSTLWWSFPSLDKASTSAPHPHIPPQTLSLHTTHGSWKETGKILEFIFTRIKYKPTAYQQQSSIIYIATYKL